MHLKNIKLHYIINIIFCWFATRRTQVRLGDNAREYIVLLNSIYYRHDITKRTYVLDPLPTQSISLSLRVANVTNNTNSWLDL